VIGARALVQLPALAAKSAFFELLSPSGLALLALLVPLVVLYVLKVKRARKRVASTWLWAVAQRDLMARSPWKRLIAQIPLLIQALALLALAFALARPATRGREFTGDHVAIVIDTSASMTAAAEGPDKRTTTRLALARAAAKDILSALTPGSDALVLEAGRDARLVAPLDRDLVRVKAAIDRIEAEDVEGDLGAAVALAVDRLRQLGGSRRIVVLTDGNLARPAALTGASLPLEVITVGAPVENTAIVRVDVRSGTEPTTGKEQVQGFLVVANFGKTPRDVYVTMREQNASDVLASRRVLVQPGERLPIALTFHPSAGDYRKGLLFELAPHDAMPVDDVAYSKVPAGDKLPVYFAGASPWIDRALVSDAMVDLHTGSVAELATDPWVGLDTLVVLEGSCPPNPPGGDLLIVNPPPGKCFGTLVGAAIERPEITSWENGDPRLRFLTLDGVHLLRASALKPDGATQELIRTQQGTIATDISTTTRTGTLLGFDVGDSDWPLKASYVLFMRNLTELSRAHRATGITGPARVGEPMRVSLPGTATKVEATGPLGEKIEVSQRGSLAIVPDIPHAGFYAITWQGPQAGAMIVPANLTSVAESDLSAAPIQADGEKVTVTASAAQPDAHTEWTWLLALGALALLVVDVWYFTRAPRARSPVAAPARPRVPERKAA
jgi:hypothetical protein